QGRGLRCAGLQVERGFSEVHIRARGRALLGIDLVSLIYELKKHRRLAHGLRRAKEQEAAGLQRVMEDRKASPLQVRAEVDQHIAAGDEIEPREGRVLAEILPCEGAAIADGTADLIIAVHLLE